MRGNLYKFLHPHKKMQHCIVKPINQLIFKGFMQKKNNLTLQSQAKHQTSESSKKLQLFLFLTLEYFFLCGVAQVFLQGRNHHLRSNLSKVLRHSPNYLPSFKPQWKMSQPKSYHCSFPLFQLNLRFLKCKIQILLYTSSYHWSSQS